MTQPVQNADGGKLPLPRYVIVGARPVRLLPTPDGSMLVEAFNWGTGEFETDWQYLTRALLPDDEVDVVDAATFDRYVADLRQRIRSPKPDSSGSTS